MNPSEPPLTVVIPTRGGLEEVAPVLEALGPAADAIGAELLVVGNTDGAEPPPGPVRLASMPVANIYALRHRGIADARGKVVAIGEDHAVPREGWCEAVIRAHAEHPEATAVVSCLVNATDATTAGRANFLAFADADAAVRSPAAILGALFQARGAVRCRSRRGRLARVRADPAALRRGVDGRRREDRRRPLSGPRLSLVDPQCV